MKAVLTAVLLLTAMNVAAETEINFGVSSEYVFRGVTQSNGAQVWGSFDYSLHDSGLYGGLWVSNAGLRGNEEVDLYLGYAFELNDALALDIGTIGYFAPSAPESASGPGDNNAEVYLGLNASQWNIYAYHNFGRTAREEDEFNYIELNYEAPVLDDASVRIHVGHFLGLGELYDLLADDSYVDYGISFTKDYGQSGRITLAVTATSVDQNHGLALAGEIAESNRPQFTVGWSRNFGNI